MKVDVIVPVMRKPALIQLLSHLEGVNDVNSIIIADFDADFTLQSLTDIKLPPIAKHINIQGCRFFNKSVAINIGCNYASAPWVLICDADVLLDVSFFTEALYFLSNSNTEKLAFIPEYVKESADGSRRPAPGICMVNKETFLKLNGYCNEFEGWGMEDQDFLSRLRLAGVRILEISFGTHLSHGNHERTGNYQNSSIAETRVINRELFGKRQREAVLSGTYSQDICIHEFYELTKNYERS